MVLDASAVVAFVFNEPGAEVVRSYLSTAAVSSVNLAEVVTYSRQHGFGVDEIGKLVDEQKLQIVPFDTEQALHAGDLVSITRSYGLSLGDRACLALARLLKVPVVTADKIWATLDVGVEVRLIR